MDWKIYPDHHIIHPITENTNTLHRFNNHIYKVTVVSQEDQKVRLALINKKSEEYLYEWDMSITKEKDSIILNFQ